MSEDFDIRGGKLSHYNGPGGECGDSGGVRTITSNAFWDGYNASAAVASLTLPQSLETICNIAFRCPNLRRLTIPKRVRTIADGAFVGCTSLEEITVDPENTSFRMADGLLLSMDGKRCIWCSPKRTGCVAVPDGVEEIGEAFRECGVERITLPKGITRLEKNAFCSCIELAGITLPEELQTIEEYAFRDCVRLREVVIPEGVDWLHYGVFAGCASLERVVLPASVRCIMDADHSLYAKASPFAACQALREVVIQGGDVTMDRNAFEHIGWDAQAAITAPKLPAAAFQTPGTKLHAALGFARLYAKGEAVPEEVRTAWLKYIRGQRKRLYKLAVDSAPLMQLMVQEKIIPEDDFAAVFAVASKRGGGEISAMLLEYQHQNFKPRDVEKEFKKQLAILETGIVPAAEAKKSWRYEKRPEGGLRILGYKGADTQVVVPAAIGREPVVEIGPYAFSPDGSPLTAAMRGMRQKIVCVTLPAGVAKVEPNAFRNCLALEAIYMTGGCQTYCTVDGVLYSADRKTCLVCPLAKPGELALPEEMLHIDAQTFANCGKLTAVQFPAGLQTIGESAFEGCKSLERIELPEKLTSVGKRAFLGCEAVKRLVIPAGLKKIKPDAFFGLGALEEIQTAPENPVCQVVDGFLLLRGKKNVPLCVQKKADGVYAIPDSVTEIPPRLFMGHEGNMKEAVIPEGVAEIKGSTFKWFKSLERVSFPGSLRKIALKAFAYCTNLRELVWKPVEGLTIGHSAFLECEALAGLALPEGTVLVDDMAFCGCIGLKSILLPASLEDVKWEAFDSAPLENAAILSPSALAWSGLEYTDSFRYKKCGIFSSDPVIHGPAGSAAEKLAEKYGYTFQPLE